MIFEHDRPPDYLINGEPTDNKLALATKGSLRLNAKRFRAGRAFGLSGTRRISD